MSSGCFMCGTHIGGEIGFRACNSCGVGYCQNCHNVLDEDACWNCGEIQNPQKSALEFKMPKDTTNAHTLRKTALEGYAKIMMDLSPAYLNAAIDMSYERLRELDYFVERNVMLDTKSGRMLVDIYGKRKKKPLIVLFAQNVGEARTNLLLFEQLKMKNFTKYLYVIKEDLSAALLETAFLQRIRVIHSHDRIR